MLKTITRLSRGSRYLVFVAFCCASSAVVAETVETSSGPVSLTRTQGTPQLTINGQVVTLPDGVFYAAIEKQLGDFILIQLGSGAQACPAQFVWFDARPAAMRLSESFGTCADLVEVSWDDRRLIVEMADITRGRGRVAFDFDGQDVTERVVAQMPVTQRPIPPGNELLGLHPQDVVGEAAYEEAFLSLLGPDVLRRARLSLQMASGMVLDGEWVVARACQQIDCPGYFGALAVSRDSARVLVALKNRDMPGQLWGDPAGPLPEEVVRVLTSP